MIVLSTLCRSNRLQNVISKASVFKNFVSKEQNALKQAFRNMSGENGRILEITPSRFQYTRFKDDLHFYISIGVIPLGLLILYVNIFTGPATLTEIPEDYEPKHWEYFKHPISRFLSKHFHDDPQILYEKKLHSLQEDKDRDEWKEKIEKVNLLMRTRDDYKAWYYIPSDKGRHYRIARKVFDEIEESKGFR